jgi:hypothetical protein
VFSEDYLALRSKFCFQAEGFARSSSGSSCDSTGWRAFRSISENRQVLPRVQQVPLDSTKLRVNVCYYMEEWMCTQERLKGKFLPSFANASPIIRSLAYEGPYLSNSLRDKACLCTYWVFEIEVSEEEKHNCMKCACSCRHRLCAVKGLERT